MSDAIDNHKKTFGKAPREVSADRGYYKSKLDEELNKIGVKNVWLPKIGNKSKERTDFENTATFKRLKRWRAGVEVRISYLKRRFGLNKSMFGRISGARTWCGFGIFAHNLRQEARVLASI